jgi:hypothetical protein
MAGSVERPHNKVKFAENEGGYQRGKCSSGAAPSDVSAGRVLKLGKALAGARQRGAPIGSANHRCQ